MNFSAGTLMASVIWGSVGLALFVYGKKQRAAGPLFGGIALVGVSYFISSPLWMSLAAMGVIAGMYFLRRAG